MAIDKLPELSAPADDRKQPNRLRWGEIVEEEDGADDDLSYLLPPKQVIGPDNNGIKKVIEYKFDEGRKVKVTTTSRVRKLNARLSKGAVARRSWSKFGGAAEVDDVGLGLTSVSREEICLERPFAIGRNAEGNNTSGDSTAEKLGQGHIMVCRTCGKKGDHWTARCPYKDLAPKSEVSSDGPGSSDLTTQDSSMLNSKITYIPPSKRGGNSSSTVPEMKRRNDDNAVRVGNLSEDACDADLLDLFRPFGQVLRAHVVKDHKTNTSRGFGFVNFANREDAQRAITKLDGYGYDNLILHVEWSGPRPN